MKKKNELKHYPYKSKGFWGGVILIVYGLYEIYNGHYSVGIMMLGAGLSLLGVRAKLEKM